MTPVESAINLAVMSNQDGVQFIYDLANSEAPQELKGLTLKELIEGYIFGVIEHGAYHMEDEVYEHAPEQSAHFLTHEFLTTIFGSILHSVNWDVIVDYHKEHRVLDIR